MRYYLWCVFTHDSWRTSTLTCGATLVQVQPPRRCSRHARQASQGLTNPTWVQEIKPHSRVLRGREGHTHTQRLPAPIRQLSAYDHTRYQPKSWLPDSSPRVYDPRIITYAQRALPMLRGTPLAPLAALLQSVHLVLSGDEQSRDVTVHLVHVHDSQLWPSIGHAKQLWLSTEHNNLSGQPRCIFTHDLVHISALTVSATHSQVPETPEGCTTTTNPGVLLGPRGWYTTGVVTGSFPVRAIYPNAAICPLQSWHNANRRFSIGSIKWNCPWQSTLCILWRPRLGQYRLGVTMPPIKPSFWGNANGPGTVVV